MPKHVIIVGSGFSSLSASCYLAKAGFEVTILEKNGYIGGRAQQLKVDGFTFDMGPTFYWMPDVFEAFFNDFSKKAADYYELNKLNPAYQVYFDENESISIGDSLEAIVETFEKHETGSGDKLKKFIESAKDNYNVAIKDLVYQPGNSLLEIINIKTVRKLGLFLKTISKQVSQTVKNKKLQQILEFPVLFLGAKPTSTPAFYNFMNYADFGLGTWHPKGGMYKVVEGMTALAKELGVNFMLNQEVTEFEYQNKKIAGIKTKQDYFEADIVLSGADYHHTEQLLPEKLRGYSNNYWENRTFAPSALLFYVGFNKKLKNISHHTLMFDTNFQKHAESIYDTPSWPEKPLFYASFSSVTDDSTAPKNHEAATFLIPIAPGIEDTEAIRNQYFEEIISRFEANTKQSVKDSIVYKTSYCINNFIDDYNSFKGNAYGLANTLFQTHFLRPKLKSKKVENLFFTGQLTVPGPGVPPAIISGKIASNLIIKSQHEGNI
jgi:phytoene desaturase